MPYQRRRKYAAAGLLLLTILTSCSFRQDAAQLGPGLCETYEPLILSDATKAFLDTDDVAIADDRKAMADNNRVWRCACTDSVEGCPE